MALSMVACLLPDGDGRSEQAHFMETGPPEAEELASLLAQLESTDRTERLAAIDELCRMGDQVALEALRSRLHEVGREHQALIIAIGTMRWRLSGTTHSSLDQH